MTAQQYLNQLLDTYAVVAELSRKNGCRVLRMRNKSSQKDLILRLFDTPVAAYDELYKIKCAHLPLIYDTIPLEDGQAVLEEYIDGLTVAQVMESGRYSYLGARRVISALCDALDVLHRQGLVHRDVKPENVMIDKNGRVVLIDFNAARKVSQADKDTVIMGTVGYASPEQLGVTQSDARTDIYALGVLLNVMVSGKHPSQQLAKGKAGKIVRRCTMVNPDERYQSTLKVAAVL